MKNLVYFCFAVIMAAIAYSIIPHSAMGDVAATVKYCDRNAAKAVSNAVANVEFMLPGLVTNQVNEYMAGKYTPSIITNVINNVETNYVSVVTNYYGTNIVVNIQTNYEETVTINQFQDVDKDWIYQPDKSLPNVRSSTLMAHIDLGIMEPNAGVMGENQTMYCFEDEKFYIKDTAYYTRMFRSNIGSNRAFRIDGIFHVDDIKSNIKYFLILCTAYIDLGTTNNTYSARTKLIDAGSLFEIRTTKAGSIPDPFIIENISRNLYVYKDGTAYYCGYITYVDYSHTQIKVSDNYYINGSGMIYKNSDNTGSSVQVYNCVPRWNELLLLLDHRYQLRQ